MNAGDRELLRALIELDEDPEAALRDFNEINSIIARGDCARYDDCVEAVDESNMNPCEALAAAAKRLKQSLAKSDGVLSDSSDAPLNTNPELREAWLRELQDIQRVESLRQTKHYIDSAASTGSRPANVTADGKIDVTKSIVGHPKRNQDGSIIFPIIWELDSPKPRPANITADGKVDITKSIMGRPRRDKAGHIVWE